MRTFKQYINDCPATLHDNAILVTLGDFIDTLRSFSAQHSDEDLTVEIQEDVPEPGTYAVRLLLVEVEKEDYK